jgi:hypothetical protein
MLSTGLHFASQSTPGKNDPKPAPTASQPSNQRAKKSRLTLNARKRSSLLILLCHKLARWQQGQRGKRRAMLRASLIRMVAIDALMWRSARIGGSARSITRG